MSKKFTPAFEQFINFHTANFVHGACNRSNSYSFRHVKDDIAISSSGTSIKDFKCRIQYKRQFSIHIQRTNRKLVIEIFAMIPNSSLKIGQKRINYIPFLPFIISESQSYISDSWDENLNHMIYLMMAQTNAINYFVSNKTTMQQLQELNRVQNFKAQYLIHKLDKGN